MPQLVDLQQAQQELVRKALGGLALMADFSQPAVNYITYQSGPDLGELRLLPTGVPGIGAWGDVGFITDAGMSFTRETSTEEITSFGRTSPTRSDIISDSSSVAIVMQETKAKTIAIMSGVDPAALVPLAGGEIKIAKPARPSSRYYRGLFIAVDEVSAGEIYIGRSFPRCKPTSFEPLAFAKGASGIEYGVTLIGEEDSDLGYTESWHFGGPGWFSLLNDMGFPAAPGAVTLVARIFTLSPTGGPAVGGTLVTIKGDGFAGLTGATGVKFGVTNATSYTVVDDQTIVATAPAKTAGPYDVIVTNAAGPSINNPVYTYA